MPVRRAGAASAGGRPTPGGSLPARRAAGQPSLRRSCRRYQVRVDTAFDQVIAALRRPARDPTAGSPARSVGAYDRLHAPRLGAQRGGLATTTSWSAASTACASAASSPASRCSTAATDASKVALVALVDRLRDQDATLLDVQWTTPHLRLARAPSTCRGAPTSSCWPGRWPTTSTCSAPERPAGGARVTRRCRGWDHGAHGNRRRRTSTGARPACQALADADLLGPLHRQGVQRAVPHQPGQGPDRAVDRLRPAHPDRLRPRRPPGPRRGRQGRRAGRPPRPHARRCSTASRRAR